MTVELELGAPGAEARKPYSEARSDGFIAAAPYAPNSFEDARNSQAISPSQLELGAAADPKPAIVVQQPEGKIDGSCCCGVVRFRLNAPRRLLLWSSVFLTFTIIAAIVGASAKLYGVRGFLNMVNSQDIFSFQCLYCFAL